MNIASVVELKPNPNIPDISPGDTVKVSAKIVEGERERIQVFQGVVIGLRRGGAGANFTVRHVFHGIGVERTFPFYSPLVEVPTPMMIMPFMMASYWWMSFQDRGHQPW